MLRPACYDLHKNGAKIQTDNLTDSHSPNQTSSLSAHHSINLKSGQSAAAIEY